MTQARKKARSPYQKYGKRPHRYSERYNAWRSATKEGRTQDAAYLAAAHSRGFGLRLLKSNGRPA
jgi:hypothetical protein